MLVAIAILTGVLAVAGCGVVWSLRQLTRAVMEVRAEMARSRSVQLLALFAAQTASAAGDPQALLVWQPLARMARRLFPDDFAALDRAGGGRAFPFSQSDIEQAHARWTGDWLAWELAHDNTYKLKAAEAAAAIASEPPSPVHRARLDAIEREKLELYQARYGQYIKVAKALQALAEEK
jgi:hypothetical protein